MVKLHVTEIQSKMSLCRDSGAHLSTLLSVEVKILHMKHLTDDVTSKHDSVLMNGARGKVLFLVSAFLASCILSADAPKDAKAE